MKKEITIVFLVLMIFTFSNIVVANENESDSVNINMSLYLDEYIETMGDVNWYLGETSHHDHHNAEIIYGEEKNWNIAYANCPFSVTIAGNNPKGDNFPRFVREEVDENGSGIGRWDSLETLLNPKIIINNEKISPLGFYGKNASEFPISYDFKEAPHNGQVKLSIKARVNLTTGALPRRKTEIDPRYIWKDSADAGTYKAKLKVTLCAL